jgi:hypothetical protein
MCMHDTVSLIMLRAWINQESRVLPLIMLACVNILLIKYQKSKDIIPPKIIT